MDPVAEVTHNPEWERFELPLESEMAVLEYKIRNGRMFMLHTEVPPAHRGHGLGGRLARAALDHARKEGLEVEPLCPFVRAYMEKNPSAQA